VRAINFNSGMMRKNTYRAVVEVFATDVIDAFDFHNRALHTPERLFK
jgi:hypothetical protein